MKQISFRWVEMRTVAVPDNVKVGYGSEGFNLLVKHFNSNGYDPDPAGSDPSLVYQPWPCISKDTRDYEVVDIEEF